MKNYSATKRDEISTHATTWMILKTLYYVEEARYERPYIVRSHLYEIYNIHKSMHPERRLVVARGCGVGEKGDNV